MTIAATTMTSLAARTGAVRKTHTPTTPARSRRVDQRDTRPILTAAATAAAESRNWTDSFNIEIDHTKNVGQKSRMTRLVSAATGPNAGLARRYIKTVAAKNAATLINVSACGDGPTNHCSTASARSK